MAYIYTQVRAKDHCTGDFQMAEDGRLTRAEAMREAREYARQQIERAQKFLDMPEDNIRVFVVKGDAIIEEFPA